ERRTEGAKLLARRMDERAGQLLRRYEAELEAARQVAGQEREHLRAEGQRLEATILAEARADAAKFMEQGRAKIMSEGAAIRKELSSRLNDIARDIAARVLGRELT